MHEIEYISPIEHTPPLPRLLRCPQIFELLICAAPNAYLGTHTLLLSQGSEDTVKKYAVPIFKRYNVSSK